MTLGELAVHEGVAPRPSPGSSPGSRPTETSLGSPTPPTVAWRAVVATDQGRDLVVRARERKDAWLTRRIAGLTPDELERLASALDVIEALGRGPSRERAPAGPPATPSAPCTRGTSASSSAASSSPRSATGSRWSPRPCWCWAHRQRRRPRPAGGLPVRPRAGPRPVGGARRRPLRQAQAAAGRAVDRHAPVVRARGPGLHGRPAARRHLRHRRSSAGVTVAFDNPARRSFVVEMVPERRHEQRRVSLNSALMTSSRISGRPWPASSSVTVGFGWAFLVDGLSYIAVLAGLGMMRTRRAAARPGHAAGQGPGPGRASATSAACPTCGCRW